MKKLHFKGVGKFYMRDTFREMGKYKQLYLFIAPYMLLFFAFTVLPVFISIFYSFTSFNILEPAQWLGLDNYLRMFLDDEVFVLSLRNTLILAAVTGPLSYLLSLLFAWFINELRPKLRAVVTLIFYAPTISGNIYLMWTIVFNNDAYGFANSLLMRTGAIQTPILWFQDPRYMMTLIIIVVLWSSLGTSFLAFIAGFQGVDKTQYEAAAVDGVTNRWQELWYVTLPCIRPQLMFGAVMSISASFGIGTIVTALCGMPSKNYAVHTIVNHLEDYGNIRFEMGYASAIATVLFFMMIGTNLVVRKILSKVGS